jgi:Flp pilus assembly protein TadG
MCNRQVLRCERAERGSAVVDFVLTSFALLAIFGSAMVIITNLYLKTVLTNAATEGARLLARADVSSGCGANLVTAQALATERVRQALRIMVSTSIPTFVSAHTAEIDGFCTAVVSVAANLPGLPLVASITNFEANAHATLELQK